MRLDEHALLLKESIKKLSPKKKLYFENNYTTLENGLTNPDLAIQTPTSTRTMRLDR